MIRSTYDQQHTPRAPLVDKSTLIGGTAAPSPQKLQRWCPFPLRYIQTSEIIPALNELAGSVGWLGHANANCCVAERRANVSTFPLGNCPERCKTVARVSCVPSGQPRPRRRGDLSSDQGRECAVNTRYMLIRHAASFRRVTALQSHAALTLIYKLHLPKGRRLSSGQAGAQTSALL